ncbi:MAG: BMP family ABC transporter substrate-binding protein [Candidatus Bipolaricaulota bacterium]|nr:MAG: BMP family ABC transporter substrate-binding protein [Candidatus Bipolaricaulota bacterium]
MLVALVGISLFAAAQGKIAIVLDVGGRGDLSFNDMGFAGADKAVAEFGLEMVEVQSTSTTDFLPNLRNLARTGEYDLIIPVGFMLGDALATTAAEYPDQKWAIVDVDWVTGPNIMNLVFLENEMSALIGCLAGMAAAELGYDYTGVVLGIPIPVLYHFEAGYRFGQSWGLDKFAELTGTRADVGMLYDYTGTFSDIALGKAASESMLAQGAVGIYNVAGPLGIGDLEAVTEFHDNAGTTSGAPFYFGVDANQDWMGMGMHALASGMKRVDVAVYEAIKSVVEGTFTGGLNVFGLANGGVAISKRADLDAAIDFGIAAGVIMEADRNLIIANWTANRATVPTWIWNAVDELEAGILDGSIVVPTANLEEEIEAIRTQYPLE